MQKPSFFTPLKKSWIQRQKKENKEKIVEEVKVNGAKAVLRMEAGEMQSSSVMQHGMHPV